MVDHDPSKYPSREMQQDWVKTYLQAFKKRSGEFAEATSEEEVEEWLAEIQKFTLVSRFIFYSLTYFHTLNYFLCSTI